MKLLRLLGITIVAMVISYSGYCQDPNTTACGYKLSTELREELLKEGFYILDQNRLGYSFFGKIENVYSQKIYFKKKNNANTKFRAVYLVSPSLRKRYVGKDMNCGWIFGFQTGRTSGGDLEFYTLDQIRFLEE